MVAAAFTETAIFRGLSNSRVMHIRLTLTDIAAAYAVAPDGNGFVQLPGDQAYALQDVIVVVGGTDTTNQEIFANSMSTGIVVDNKSNLNTANNRQFQQAPIPFKAGTLLRFKQGA
jgi:hypothetical protein